MILTPCISRGQRLLPSRYNSYIVFGVGTNGMYPRHHEALTARPALFPLAGFLPDVPPLLKREQEPDSGLSGHFLLLLVSTSRCLAILASEGG